jgi:hypothetical protein
VIDASSPLNGCGDQPSRLQKLQVLNNSRAGYGQTARELASRAGYACESLKNDYADRETEQREQAQHLPEQCRLSVGFGHWGSVTPH